MHDEFAGRINVIARINAYFLGVKCSNIGHIRVEMNVGNQWCLVAISTQLRIDMLQIFGFARALCGQTHQFSARFDNLFGLSDACFRVVGVGGCHALHAYGELTPHINGTHMHGGCFPSFVLK